MSCRSLTKSEEKNLKTGAIYVRAQNKVYGIPVELLGDKSHPCYKLLWWFWENWLKFLYLVVCICKTITDVILKCVVRFTCQVLGILEREEPSEVSHRLTEDVCKILYEPLYVLQYGFSRDKI